MAIRKIKAVAVTLRPDKFPDYYSATIDINGVDFKSNVIKKVEGWSYTLDIPVKTLEKRIIQK